MIGKNTGNKRMASLSEVLEILEERKTEGELGYEQQIEYDYAKKFAKLSKSDAEKMKKELIDAGLGEKTALKTIEIMPTEVIQLKLIMVIEKLTLDDATLKKIMDIVNSYRGK